jgi:hypothetical protein
MGGVQQLTVDAVDIHAAGDVIDAALRKCQLGDGERHGPCRRQFDAVYGDGRAAGQLQPVSDIGRGVAVIQHSRGDGHEGVVTAVAAGEADISATYQNVTGRLHIAIVPAGPSTPTLTAISVTGSIPDIGKITQFNAVALYSDGTSKEVTNLAVWRSSNTAAATVNSGQVRGIAAGETDISASYQGLTGTLHITVGTAGSTTATVISVSVTGAALGPGLNSQFGATATLSDRTSRNVTSLASWKSSDPSVAAVVGGLVLGVAAGQADISATYQGVTGTTHVVVQCAIATFPTVLSIAASGETATLTVSAGTGCSWSARSNDSFVTVTSGASASGGGIIRISVAANPGVARSGSLTIAGNQVTINQAGVQAPPDCGASVLPASAGYSAELELGTLTVTVSPGCQWTASTSSAFISLFDSRSRTGSGSLVYRVFGNLTGAPRSGSITVGQRTVSVTQRAALGGNSLSFVSDAGDYVGEGWTVLHEAPTSTITPSLNSSRNQVHFQIIGSDGVQTLFWALDLAAPSGQVLAPGTYLNATQYPFQAPTVPGLGFGGDGRACGKTNGQFTITDFAADVILQRLTATFEQHCDGAGPALRGKIVYVR